MYSRVGPVSEPSKVRDLKGSMGMVRMPQVTQRRDTCFTRCDECLVYSRRTEITKVWESQH